MGRKQINHEQVPARLPAGTLKRIEAAREEGEPIAAFIREAVERELKRRERSKS
jgi:predicted DNA-binding protein